MSEIRIRASEQDGIVEVRALLTHPMETGQRTDDDGQPIPADFIREVTCTHGDRVVLHAYWGTGVSANPFLSFRFRGGAAGDTITLSWTDNQGRSASQDAVIQ